MNPNETPSFFPSCASYETPPWNWRQDGCYPYYAEPPPINPRLDLPSLPADGSSSSCTTGGTECNLSNDPPNYNDSNSALPGSCTEEAPQERLSESHFVEKSEAQSELQGNLKQEATSSDSFNSKKKRDRFNGMTEEDVLKRTVPDLLCPNLDIIIIGSCPGLTAAYLGHHYAGPGNHFWKCLYLSGLIPEPMNASDDYKLKQYGIGFTNFVARCSKGSVEFSRYAITREIKEGVESLTEKIQTFKPKIAVFNGKGIYEVFCNHKNFYIGKQPEPFPGTNTVVYVMPSSSARCSQLPRASDKVPFFVALRKLRDHLRGLLPHLDETEIVFPDLDLKVEPRKDRRVSDEPSSQPEPANPSHHSAAEKDRKRKHIDCNFNAVDMTHERIYRPALPPSFSAAVPQDMSQEFKWNSGFHKWPPGLGLSHSNAALVGMNSRMDCTYDSLLAKQEESQMFNACGLLRGLPSGPFYGGWSDGQNRWAMNGLATRFNSDACYPVNIPAYLQYPDMISCADRLAGHLPETSYRSVYPNLSAYSQEAFLPDPATSAPSSAFSYNSSLNHDIKAPGSQFDPVFFQRPAHSPPSYYHQYR